MVKKYSPAHVSNPTSMQHLVYLHPGQSLVLSLSREGGKSTVEIAGDYLKLESSSHQPPVEKFHIVPNLPFDDFDKYSNFYLGEVWIDRPKSISKLIVVQACDNPQKKNYLTVVNPESVDLRIYPYNIVEVVLYDLDFAYQDEWNWRWWPLEHVDVDCLRSDTFSPYCEIPDDPSLDFATASCIVPGNSLCRQHHFWFRLGKSVLRAAKKEIGVVHVGDFTFVGKEKKFVPESRRVQMNASVYVDFRKSHISRIFETLNLKENTSILKNRYAAFTKKKALPTIKKVDIKKILSHELCEGCKVISARPSATQMVAYDEYEILKHFDSCPDDQQWSLPHWKKWD